MDLWQLHIFRKVVELASFSRAADAVHLSQPTISSHVKDLENHFGCPLIDRLSRCAVPTKAGDLLYTYTLRMLALREEMETALEEFQGRHKGHLCIGGSTIPGGYLLPRIIGGFNRVYPDIRLSLQISDSRRIVQKTLAGEIELGFVGASFPDTHLQKTELARDVLKLIVPPDHAWAARKVVEITELRGEAMIVRESGSGTRQVVKQALERAGLEMEEAFRIVAEIGHTAGIVGGIKSGLGVSIMSTRAVEDDLRSGGLMALDIRGIDLERPIYMVLDERRTLSPLALVFQDYVRENLPRSDLFSVQWIGAPPIQEPSSLPPQSA